MKATIAPINLLSATTAERRPRTKLVTTLNPSRTNQTIETVRHFVSSQFLSSEFTE